MVTFHSFLSVYQRVKSLSFMAPQRQPWFFSGLKWPPPDPFKASNNVFPDAAAQGNEVCHVHAALLQAREQHLGCSKGGKRLAFDSGSMVHMFHSGLKDWKWSLNSFWSDSLFGIWDPWSMIRRDRVSMKMPLMHRFRLSNPYNISSNYQGYTPRQPFCNWYGQRKKSLVGVTCISHGKGNKL